MQILKIDTLEPDDCRDPDQFMLHAAFQCLVNWVKETQEPEPWGCCDGEDKSEERLEAERVFLSLYDWWTEVRPKRPNAHELERENYEEDTRKLLELVKRRRHLWT
jgi:hypothetical protein